MVHAYDDRSFEVPGARPRPPGSDVVERLRDLATDAIGRPVPEAMGVYIFRPGDEGAALPRAVVQSVFEETYAASEEQLDDEFSPYDRASLLVCVLDHRRRLPAGALRIIMPSPVGLKTLNEIESLWQHPYRELFATMDITYDPRHTWNLSTLAVAPDYRTPAFQGLITLALTQAASLIANRCDMLWWIATIYMPVLRMIQWKFHQPFNDFAGLDPLPHPDHDTSALPTRGYMGRPVWGRLPDWYGRLAEKDRVLYDIMVNGTGLEAAMRPADWDGAADAVRRIMAVSDLRLTPRSPDAAPGSE
ncbi:MAG TPA: hypothetical protein VGL60_00635 [Acidimicrobiales bacterium]|jgi:hypothetical protein